MTIPSGNWLKWPQRVGGVLLAIILLPVALVAGIWHTIRGGANTAPDELAEMLRGVAKEGDDSGYWDELECVNLRDVRLEAIRQEALRVSVPLAPEGRSKLLELAEQAEALSSRP
jgi:hypothetical protein